MLKQKLLLSFLVLIFSSAAIGQPMDSLQRPMPNAEFIPESRMEQHEKWLQHEEQFPAKPRSMWQIGLSGGMLRLTSDVQSEMGYGYGAYIRKGLGYTTSLRLRYLRGNAYGLNWYPTNNTGSNPALNGTYDGTVDYYNENTNNGMIYHNYKMEMQELSLELLYSFNNIKFHKRKDIFSPYLFVGLGAMIYNTKYDQLDATGQMYDYESVPLQSGNINDKKAQERALKDLLDGEYETTAERDDKAYKFRGEESLEPVLNVGVGAAFRLSKRFEVGLEHKLGLVRTDYLDGQHWNTNFTISDDKDMTHFTSLNLGVNLGKQAAEPEWWVNPLEYVYDYISYLDEKTDFADDDDDGVPNLWDEEPDTPEGAVVDTKGRTMDSDGDGCPDHEDPEPFSTPQFPIVDCENVYPFVDSAQVVDLIKEYSVSGAYLPTIHFETDKSKIMPQFYSDLKYIGELMNKNKSIKLDVTGHADYRYTEEYNLALSQRRAESAVNFLVDNYGVDRSRFNIKYEGETDPLIENAKTAAELYMNRRVEFQIAEN